MPTDDLNFGRDRFIRKNGQRLRTRMVRTIQPRDGEVNADFERRMERLVDVLEQMAGTIEVAYEYERRDGHIVECLIDMQHEPRPVAVLEDDTPAGGRNGSERGQRGQRGSRGGRRAA